MAAITITTNFRGVLNQVTDKIKQITDPEYLLRPAALEAISLIHPRIHVRGQASDGSQIGTYSKGYIAYRSGVFQNSDRFKKGVNKGKIKNAGTFSKKRTTFFTQEDEETVSSKTKFVKGNFGPRTQFHRGTDSKVIISLTRQLESDYKAIPLGEKSYGVGFSNSHNFDKSQWVEQIYDKKIFDLTPEEQKKIEDLIQTLVNQALQA